MPGKDNGIRSTQYAVPLRSLQESSRRLWFRLVRWSFRQLYGPLAWAYDGVAWAVSRGEWQRWGRAALPWVEGERVLELGCGPGHLLGELAAWGWTAVGLDLSPAMLRLARQRLRWRELTCRLVRGRAQALPFADQAFDAVVVIFPAEFIGHPATLAEIARVLPPDGRFVLADEGRHLGQDPWSRLLNWALDVTNNRATLAEVMGRLAGGEQEAEFAFIVTHGLVRGARSVVRVVVARRRGGEARDGRAVGSPRSPESRSRKRRVRCKDLARYPGREAPALGLTIEEISYEQPN